MIYVAYEDSGPSGPCGQSVEITMPWQKLYVFKDREAARPFIEKVRAHQITGRSNPRIARTWDSDEPGQVIVRMTGS